MTTGWVMYFGVTTAGCFLVTAYHGPLFARGDMTRFWGTSLGLFFVFFAASSGIAESTAKALLGAVALTILFTASSMIYGLVMRKRTTDRS